VTLVIRVAGGGDVAAIASLRAHWRPAEDPRFARRLAAWFAAEGDRRTTWLATLSDTPAGMGSLFEYRRMPQPGQPDTRWGYVGNLFVHEALRGRGIGSELLAKIVAAADARGYARLVLSPSERAVPFFQRAGFVAAGSHELLIRPAVTSQVIDSGGGET
jgi:GNAT superfamily N-acetyltransferase